MILIAFIALALCRALKRGQEQSILIALLAVYIYIILMLTLLDRSAYGSPRAELTPLWSWMRVINGYRRFWYLGEILLNVLLFIPFGALLEAAFEVKWQQALVIGFGCSLLIETVQYFSCRGLFEWDDMIHNTLGCVIGAAAADLIRKAAGLKNRTD